MKPNRIKYELSEKGFSQTDIASDLKVTPEAVNMIIKKVGKSRNIQDYISKIIGGTHDEIWIKDPHIPKEKR